MAFFSGSFVTEKQVEAEEHIARELKCILDRKSFAVSVGEGLIELPTYVFGITRVLYKGSKLYPLEHESARQHFAPFKPTTSGGYLEDGFEDEAFAVSNSRLPQGKPRWYVYDSLGVHNIQLYPSPNEAVSVYASGLWGSNIGNAVIVEFYRLPDTSDETKRIPSYLRQILFDAYVNWKGFKAEAETQDLEAASYFEQKFKRFLKLAVLILKGVYTAQDNSSLIARPRVIQGPQLPSNYGRIVR